LLQNGTHSAFIPAGIERSKCAKEGIAMRHHILITSLFLVSSFFALPALAQTADGITPAIEGVCDDLKNPGVTKGLYGLCVAYCEAEASSEAVLRNYDRKKQESDPEMPCLEVVVPCPCWDTDTLAAAEGPSACVASEGGINSSEYFDLTTFAFSGFYLFPNNELTAFGCLSFAGGVGKDDLELTPEETASCLASLSASQAIDFPGGCQ